MVASVARCTPSLCWMTKLARGIDRVLDDATISIYRMHPSLRAGAVPEGSYLEPRLWERLRQRLQEEYRRATGEHQAVLVIENPSTGA